MSELLDKWCDPYGQYHRDFPAGVARRLEQMPGEILAEFKDRDLAGRVFYERFHALLAAVGVGGGFSASAFDPTSPPAEAERLVGLVIGQAFHQGCSLDDVALATGLPPDLVVEIGKRTIKRKKWLQRMS